jgi:hypothetical protein
VNRLGAATFEGGAKVYRSCPNFHKVRSGLVHLTFVNLRLTDSTLSYERLAAAAFDAYLETKGLHHSVAV